MQSDKESMLPLCVQRLRYNVTPYDNRTYGFSFKHQIAGLLSSWEPPSLKQIFFTIGGLTNSLLFLWNLAHSESRPDKYG